MLDAQEVNNVASDHTQSYTTAVRGKWKSFDVIAMLPCVSKYVFLITMPNHHGEREKDDHRTQ